MSKTEDVSSGGHVKDKTGRFVEGEEDLLRQGTPIAAEKVKLQRKEQKLFNKQEFNEEDYIKLWDAQRENAYKEIGHEIRMKQFWFLRGRAAKVEREGKQ